MVPFHESDVAENRWKEDEWRQFELWERIEIRLRRKRTWTIAGVIVLFLGILSIPIIQDRAPKWRALGAMRALAVRVNQMKVDASSLGVPLRLRLEVSDHGPNYVIERVKNCKEPPTSVGSAENQEWSRGPIFSSEAIGRGYTLLSTEEGKRHGLERVVDSFCYEPALLANGDEESPQTPSRVYQAMGILTAKDLTDGRLDRVAFLNFSGLSAEIDFD